LVRFVCDVLRERSRIQMGVFGYQREDHCSWQCIEPWNLIRIGCDRCILSNRYSWTDTTAKTV